MILKLAFKNVISRKSSIVIVLFMAFAVMLFCVANALFDSTEHGVQSTYVSSFTGDLIIRPKSEVQVSLFGDETPLTGEFTKIQNIVPYSSIVQEISANVETEAILGQITGIVRMELGDVREGIYLFGVDGDDYVAAMKSIKILEGSPYIDGTKGIMLSSKVAEAWKAKVGDTMQFSFSDGPVFRIRATPVSAIFEYETHNSIFERFAIVDADTLRSLLDLSDSVESVDLNLSEEKVSMLDDDFDLESMFDEAEDTGAVLEEVKETPVVEEKITEPVVTDSTAWNFLLIRLKNGLKTKSTIKKLNSIFKKNGWPVEATDWRHAAGSTALYLYWLRLIFNIGIIVILFAGFIIVANSLVINILDRTKEIGTMRAIGAKKRFISKQCLAESFMMTLTSGVLGILLGILVSFILTNAHITFTNDFLIQLFGSNDLKISVSFKIFLSNLFL